MGRKKIEIEKLESEAHRKATYRKRSKGLIKKAEEISVLSDVDVALIMFSCSGKLDHFSSQPGIWKILQRFIQNIPDDERRLISQDNINTINMLAEEHEYANQYREEIKEEIVDNVDIHQELLQLRNRMMLPSREAFKSQQQFAGLLQSLENVRQTVVSRRVQMQMQQMHEVPEAGIGVPLQVQDQIPQQRLGQILQAGNPSTSQNAAELVTSNLAGSPYVDMSGALLRAHQQWMFKNRTIGDPCSSGYAATNFSTGKENFMGSDQLLPVKVESVSIDVPEVGLDLVLPEEHHREQNAQQGVDFFGGVRTMDEQLYDITWWNEICYAMEPDGTA